VNPFLVLFSLITAISVVVSASLMLIRRKMGPGKRGEEDIRSSVFNFYTTLYAFVIGFAIVTLWSAFLTAKADVTREADDIMIAYRAAQNLPGSDAFRQDAVKYLKVVIDVEFPQMQEGAMSPEASRLFDRLWSDLYELKGDSNMIGQIYSSLTEAEHQRLARSILLESNLYPPIWVILIFGLVSVVFGLYYINRQQTVVSLIFEFMAIFLLLSCIYFVYDLDTPFSGLINVKPQGFQTVYAKILSLQ
jgi:hypothetical protein